MNASRFDQFPDIWVTNSTFRELKRVSNGDAQRAAFSWGTGELVKFKNIDGVPLKGVLLKPDNFDPREEVPDDRLHLRKARRACTLFAAPGRARRSIRPTTSATAISSTCLTSFTRSAIRPQRLKCVLPGIQAVDKGLRERERDRDPGTQLGRLSDRLHGDANQPFAAPGALVANMTSAYSGIRWGTACRDSFNTSVRSRASAAVCGTTRCAFSTTRRSSARIESRRRC